MICGLRYYRLDKVGDGLVEVHCLGGITYALRVPINAEFDIPQLSINGLKDMSSAELPYIFVHHHITEQGQFLCGFPDKEDRKLFQDLLEVDGVGPGLSLKIMSFYPSEKIRIDIADGDVEDLCKAKGVGKKSAEKIIATLKEKYAPYSSKKEVTKQDFGADMSGLTTAMSMAEKALIKLAFPAKEAKRRVEDALKIINKEQMAQGKFGERPCEEIVPELIRGALSQTY